jgi:hypothetical protein
MYSHGICLDGLTKTTMKSVRVACLVVEIRTGPLQKGSEVRNLVSLVSQHV